MKVAYIAGPFRGKTAWQIENNVRRAEEVALAVSRLGVMPLCPHTNTRFFQGEGEDQVWIDGTLELLKRSDALVLVPPPWEQSSGTRGEVAWVKEHNATISEPKVVQVPMFQSERLLDGQIIIPGLVAWLRGDRLAEPHYSGPPVAPPVLCLPARTR